MQWYTRSPFLKPQNLTLYTTSLHLFNWYRMMHRDVPIKKDFRQAVVDVFTKTWKNSLKSDFKGKALLAYVAAQIGSVFDLRSNEKLEQMVFGNVEESGSPLTRRLETSRFLWDAGHTSTSIETLWWLIEDAWLFEDSLWFKGEDDREVLTRTLQVFRTYVCSLNCFWDTNRRLWEIYHSQLASQVPQLQRYIEIHEHSQFWHMPNNVFDRILNEEPAYCISPDVDGDTLLHTVYPQGSADVPPSDKPQRVQKLLDKGIDVNHKNHKGQTALHTLFKWHSVDYNILKLLIGHEKVDINVQDGRGETVLHYLCAGCSENNGSLDALELVLGHPNINVGIRDEKGRIPADCLPRATTANLLDKHPFLRRLFQSTSLADRPQGATAGQDSSTYTPLPPAYSGAYIPALVPYDPLTSSHLAAFEPNALS